MPDLSFSSDALRTAAQYVDEAATCTKVTPPTGDPCSRVYAARISGPISNLNEEDKHIRDALDKTHTDMEAMLQEFESMEQGIVDSLSMVLKR